MVLFGLWPALKMPRQEISRMMASEHHACELMEVAKGMPPNTLLDLQLFGNRLEVVAQNRSSMCR